MLEVLEGLEEPLDLLALEALLDLHLLGAEGRPLDHHLVEDHLVEDQNYPSKQHQVIA